MSPTPEPDEEREDEICPNCNGISQRFEGVTCGVCKGTGVMPPDSDDEPDFEEPEDEPDEERDWGGVDE